ncbi:MAG: ThuA domain-containing protein [Candidatus Sumerlaeia bacterium]
MKNTYDIHPLIKYRTCSAIMLIGTLALLSVWPFGVQAQEAKQMENFLRPYLDRDFVPVDGPDTDKEFILKHDTMIREALPEKLKAVGEKKPKILLLTQGTYGALHVPGAAGMIVMLRASVEKHNAFELTEIYSDSEINAEMLKEYDAVILNNVGRTRNPKIFNEILPEYVSNGGGLFANHSCLLLLMSDPKAEFNRMIGGYVYKAQVHPKMHGKSFSVELAEPDHPLMAAFHGKSKTMTRTHSWLSGDVRKSYDVAINPPKQLADELYVILRPEGEESLPRVLLEIAKEGSPQVFPEVADDFSRALVWVKTYGKGRIYYTQFGHNTAVYSVPCIARSMLEGVIYVSESKGE